MMEDENLDLLWPPRGWRSLSFIQKLNGQTIFKDPRFATIEGACYQIKPISIFDKNPKKAHQKTLAYRLEIKGWTYSIQNESQEFNILSFIFRERPHARFPKMHHISDIKIKSRPILLSERSASRAYMAAILMIKQIMSDKPLDYERILKLYKIHPTHLTSSGNFYKRGYERDELLYSGALPPDSIRQAE